MTIWTRLRWKCPKQTVALRIVIFLHMLQQLVATLPFQNESGMVGHEEDVDEKTMVVDALKEKVVMVENEKKKLMYQE